MDISILINWLNSSKLQSTNNSLYQTIKALIDQANVSNTEITAIKSSGGGGSSGGLTLAAGTLAGRRSSSAGPEEQITLGTNLAITGTVLDATSSVTITGTPANGNLTKFSSATSITNGDLSGDISTTGTLTTTIGANKVTDTMLRDSAALSIIGRSANSVGDPGDISSSANEQILGRRASVVGWTAIQSFGYWSPLTNGDPVTPELIFDGSGDAIAVWTAL